MGLKVWSIILALGLILAILISFLIGIVGILELGLLVFAILLLLATYLTLTRKDPLTRVPTALEIEKMKRKMKVEDSGIVIEPGKKT